jgi:hypothetical protein
MSEHGESNESTKQHGVRRAANSQQMNNSHLPQTNIRTQRVSNNRTCKQLQSAPEQQRSQVHRCRIAALGCRLLLAQGRIQRALAHHRESLAYRAAAGLRKKTSINKRRHVGTVSNAARCMAIHRHTLKSWLPSTLQADRPTTGGANK